MKIEINVWHIGIPSPTDKKHVDILKQVIGTTVVDGYTLDKDYKIIKGKCCIKNNERWNYHNNYDASEDAMFFEDKEKWFTLSEEEIRKFFNIAATEVREQLLIKLEEYAEL